jgi:tRNA(fMet)-specific endonuclease VapC
VKYLLDTDHISFLQRHKSVEFSRLMVRMNRYSSGDFALSAVSFHEQTLGAHNFINRAHTNNDIIRGYNLILEILQGFSSAPVLPFDAEAIEVFDELRAKSSSSYNAIWFT